MPLWRPGLCYAPSSPSSTTTPSKTPRNCCSFSSMHSRTTSKRYNGIYHSRTITNHIPQTSTPTERVNLCVYVYKVAKRQMRSSIRQPRQDQNRTCATAAAESTIVSHVFEGRLSYMTLCMHCDHQAHSTQTFTVLSLPIPTGIIKCSIQVPSNSCVSHFAPLKTSSSLSYFRYWWSWPYCSVLSHNSVSTLCRIACRCSSSRRS